jgi:light-regulated signal transduction histidine kinase (bacteriophytochrome)
LLKDEQQKPEQQKELDELTYIISHDLQEPLRMITSYVQLLKKKYGDKLDDNARDYIEYAVQGTDRLKQMMDSLLSYSRIGRPELILRRVRLKRILEETEKLLRTRYKDRSFLVTDDFEESEIVTDEDLLTKLFYHIIENALKFNHSQLPAVNIGLKETQEELVISLSDNGMGIDKEYHGKIFGIFQKLHNHEEFPGSGMGLAICEKIVTKLGGSITVDSEKGNGAVFHIKLRKGFNS